MFERTMREWHTIACAAWVLCAGCAADVDAPAQAGDEVARASAPIQQVDGATVAELGEGTKLVLDLRNPERAYALAAGMSSAELERIVVVCPNGVRMGMREWLATDTTLARTFVEAQSGWLGVSADEVLARHALSAEEPIAEPECEDDCYLCPDGVWVCRSTCGDPTRTGDGAVYEPWQWDPAFSGDPSEPPHDPYSGGSTPSGSGSSGGGAQPSSPDPGGHPGR